MKILNFALIISLLTMNTTPVFAVTTQNETDTNATLLQNAKASREAVNAKDTTSANQQIHAIGTGTVTPTNSSNLTDQEKELSQNYIHQGLANQIITDNCSGKDATVCNGEAGSHKFLGVDSNMIKAAAQAYALFSALTGDSLGKITSKAEAAKNEANAAKAQQGTSSGEGTNNNAADSKSAEGADKTAASDKKGADTEKAEDEKVSDYCKYIPTVTEGVATAVQLAKSKELSADETGNGDTAQRDALLKAAKSHDSRAKMAQIQAVGWFGGAACYAVNAARPDGWAVDKNLVIKMGAATLLGTFYQSEVSANKEYADKTRAIAKSLPGKGDCNPITDNLCYCSQPSTENDTTYCVKGLSTKAIAASSYRVACTNDQLQIDATCACEKTNTCFDTYLETQSDGSLSLGGLAYGTSPFKSVRALARGELLGSTLNTSSTDSTSAIAKKALRELTSKLDGNNLNKDQKAMADAMTKNGVPANVASLMASGQVSKGSFDSAMGKISGSSSGVRLASVGAVKTGSNIVDFSGGNGLGYKGNVKAAEGNGAEELLAKLKPGQKAVPNSKIIEFAQKAENQAKQNGQIRNQNDTPLFEIISLRYQTSGRRLLEVEESK